MAAQNSAPSKASSQDPRNRVAFASNAIQRWYVGTPSENTIHTASTTSIVSVQLARCSQVADRLPATNDWLFVAAKLWALSKFQLPRSLGQMVGSSGSLRLAREPRHLPVCASCAPTASLPIDTGWQLMLQTET